MITRLEATRIELVPLDVDLHADDLHNAFASAAIMEFWDSPSSARVEDSRAVLTNYLGYDNARQWVIREAQDGPAVGLVGLFGAPASTGIHWLLRPEWQGKGYATEAVRAVTAHAFRNLEVQRIEAWIHPENVRSIGVAYRTGFQPRGRLVQRFPHRTSAHTSLVLGLSADAVNSSVVGVVPEMVVGFPDAVSDLLTRIFRGRATHVEGDPAEMVTFSLDGWSGSNSLTLSMADEASGYVGAPVEIRVDVATLDGLFERAEAEGVQIVLPPTPQPWMRTEFAFELPEGHRFTASAPT